MLIEEVTRQPWADYGQWLRTKFGKRMQKISINSGSSCPNRHNGLGACAWCDGTSFLPAYCTVQASPLEQLHEGLKFFEHKSSRQDYLVYFQAYTSTWADEEALIKQCDELLTVPGVQGILMASRPDTLSEGLLDAFARLSEQCYFGLELGVESCLDKTLISMNRGHDYACVEKAFEQAHSRGLNIGAHLILGLPGESYQDQIEQAKKISLLKPHSLKLHHLQVLANSGLAKRFKIDPNAFSFPSMLEYRDLVSDFLEHLTPDIHIERFLNEAPPERIVAPHWGGIKNYAFADKLRKYMIAQEKYQGRLVL